MPVWISKHAAIAIHAELLAEHGGLQGAINEDALESTLARPQNVAAYNHSEPSIYEFAAAYGFGFARNHCFSDGNKRIALEAIDVFLLLNGHELTASEPEAVITIQLLAAGEIDEKSLAKWIEQHSKPL